MSGRAWTPGPWELVWWGNETYPYPLSILADNRGKWIARDGTVSSPANARLIAAAADMADALARVIARYDADHPMRTADVHRMDCGCMRCAVDAARAALSKATEGGSPVND